MGEPHRRLDTSPTDDGGVRVNIHNFDDVKEIAKRLDKQEQPRSEGGGIRFSIPSGHPLDGSDMYLRVGLRFHIAFENGFPVDETLRFLYWQVRQVVETFKPDFEFP